MSADHTCVLVCGAGPTGLMAACQLALHGIPFRLIDKSDAATTQSRALVLHARSMEIFKQMGIVEQVLALGEICHGVTWVFNGKETAHIKLTGEEQTEFPYVFCLEQSKTEEILINFLKKQGHEVERQVELIDYTKTETHITAKLKHADNTIETVFSDYLIGADGAHSIVREKMHLNLEGSTYLQTLFVIDCQVKANIRPNEIYLIMSSFGLIGLFPMVQTHNNPSEKCHRYRVLGILPESHKNQAITFEEIQQNFSERIAMPGEIFDAAWISTYHAHHRHAKTFREGPCFIIGDAAHIHSPVGGQGMNTGLQDAYNLIWKLALVIRKQAQDKLLDSFNVERMQVAKNLVNSTDKIFYMIAGESWLIQNFRRYLLPCVLRFLSKIVSHVAFIAKRIFSVISQLSIQYPQSFLSQEASSGSFINAAPKPGERFPFLHFQENNVQKNIQDFLQGTKFHCFIFTKDDHVEKTNLLSYLQKKDNIITTHVISYRAGTESLYQALGITESGYYLVRPDTYIAYRAASLKIEPLDIYLSRFLN